MPSQDISAPDVYAILSGWSRHTTGNSTPASQAQEDYLQAEATAAALELNQRSTLQVQLNQHGIELKRLLQRRAVEAWRALHQPLPDYASLPDRCPTCGGLLVGQWTCELCGLELFRWSAAGGAQVSLDSMGALPWSYVLIPDARRQRLIILHLGQSPEVVWQINLPQCQPVAAVLLPGQEILLADAQGRVRICNLFGEWLWECSLPLKKPVFVDATRDAQMLLIADQALHQVFVINREQKMLWSYGQAGQSGADAEHLNQPSCVRLTQDGSLLIADTGNGRVLEVSELSRQSRQLAVGKSFKNPVWCERLPNGHTLILDAETYKLSEFDAQQHEVNGFHYYQSHLDIRYRLQQPTTVVRRENGQVMLANPERVVEIAPHQKRLLWFSLLTDLRAPASFAHLQTHAAAPQSASLEAASPPPVKRSGTLQATRLQTPFRLGEALKQVSVFEAAPETFFEKIKLCLRYEEHPAGKILLREGQKGDAMYLIREGQVEILKEFQAIATLGPGEIFGEMALLNAEPRTATVRLKTPARLYRLNRLAFESVIQAFPEVHERVKQLAKVRQQMGQAPAPPATSARERLESLMQKHRHRLEELRQQPPEPVHHKLLEGPLHWTLRYSSLEQNLIRQARQANHRCLEVHVRLRPDCQMKSVRISLLVMNLEKQGDIIRMHPLPEDILQEQVDDQVIFTLLTRHSRARILEEACALAEIQDAQAIPVQF